MNYKLLSIVAAIISVSVYFVSSRETKGSTAASTFQFSEIKTQINKKLKESTILESSAIVVNDRNFNIEYTIDEKLNNFVKSRLKYYRPDMIAVVVLENDTGKILSSVGFERATMSFNDYLPFSGTHPSASIFKIVTTAELLRDGDVQPDSEFVFRGKGTTLYKSQLAERKDKRWTRTTNFEKAFAMSNNVVFGKAAIENTTPIELTQMAEKLGFNQELMREVSLSKSHYIMPEPGYNLAESASGFNSETQISPVHCAVLSSVIANDGELVYPRLVERISDTTSNSVFTNTIRKKTVINKDVSQEIKTLMSATVEKGTARRKFRKINKKIGDKLEIGGKTGSITGGLPFGKRDWFTSYAIPRDQSGNGISLCVMNINFKKWYVKSAQIAEEIIQYYYKDIKKLE